MTDMKNFISDEALDMVVGGAGTLYVTKITDAAGTVIGYNAVGTNTEISEFQMSALKSGALDKLTASSDLMVFSGIKPARWEKVLSKASKAGYTNVQYLN